MNLTVHSTQNRPLLKPVPGAAQAVLCVHCYRVLGNETTKTSRKKLLAKHQCAEKELAKHPAAPPPYN